jgi:cupin fold WbuC family metalloprotein
MRVIDKVLLNGLSLEASENVRRRKNLNFHSSPSDPLQRMLNAFEPGTYVRPHRHADPAKREVFVLLSGKVAVLFFNNDGQVIKSVTLSHNDGVLAVEVEPGEWHAVVSLEKGSVVYEIKDGPYDVPTDKDFAPWAPLEGSLEAPLYLERLQNEAG